MVPTYRLGEWVHIHGVEAEEVIGLEAAGGGHGRPPFSPPARRWVSLQPAAAALHTRSMKKSDDTMRGRLGTKGGGWGEGSGERKGGGGGGQSSAAARADRGTQGTRGLQWGHDRVALR